MPLRDPSWRCACAKRNEFLLPQSKRVRQTNMRGYGEDKVRERMKRRQLARTGIEPSVGSYDNTLNETINSLYKAELIHRRVP